MFIRVESWTQSKASSSPLDNEDVIYADKQTLVMADGATNKQLAKYKSGKFGGRELAELATTVVAKSNLSGYELIDEVTQAVRSFYSKHNPEALSNSSQRSASTLVAVRTVEDRIIITQVGDTDIRVTKKDGSQVIYSNDKQLDRENAALRADYINSQLKVLNRPPTESEFEEIIQSARGVIQDRLNQQHKLQNNASDRQYGYGIIDGQDIPKQFHDGSPTNFVKLIELNTGEVAVVEVVSDGFYGQFPKESTITAYKDLYKQIHRQDPAKYQQYPSTKPIDDASVIIAHLA